MSVKDFLKDNFGTVVGSGSGLLGSVINYFSARKSAKEAQAFQDKQNEFNMQQYEDWKHYNSLDERLKRANEAGVSPFAALGVNDTLPSAFQLDNQFQGSPAAAGLDAISKGVQNIGKTVENGYERYLSHQERKFDAQLRKETLELQKQQLEALKLYRKEVMENNIRMFREKLDWQKDSFLQGLNFKKQFYSDPVYMGYWNTQLAKQRHGFNAELHPVELSLMRNRATMARTENKYLADYLSARNASAYANSKIAGINSAVRGNTFVDEAKALKRRYQAVLSDPNLYPAIQWINWATDEANDILSGISTARNFSKSYKQH